MTKVIFNLTGHFPWLFKSRLTKYLLSCTEGGKAVAYVRNVTLDLIRIRRESEHGNKVHVTCKILSLPPGPLPLLYSFLSVCLMHIYIKKISMPG